MYLLINKKDNKIIWYSSFKFITNDDKYIKEVEVQDVEIWDVFIDWKIVKKQYNKEKDILEYIELKNNANKLKNDYELYKMSDSILAIKTRELLESKTNEIKLELENKANLLVERYWEDILSELI